MTPPPSPALLPSADLIPRTDLPVEETIDDLRRALHESSAAVLVAPPGAGKTTLVPLRLLEEPWLDRRRIMMLEPRRLAARAAARRISQMIGDEPGGLVGYQTRDERVIGPTTRLEIVTEGILTRRLQHDPSLEGYGLVIFDEVHERNLATDLGLALCIDTRTTLRPDLRILAMSATPDADSFSRVLGSHDRPAPIVRSEGRMFDVDIVWAPPARHQRLDEAMTLLVGRALREQRGDVLVFLPGVAEIERVRRSLESSSLPADVDIRPLAGALALEDQDRALSRSPEGRRRVVLSTDIAETSLTVDGIRIVVDAGQARIPQFDARTGMTRLTTVAASRASCDQRAGRAGRIEPGVVYRAWSKLEHGTRRAHLDPEISHADLASFALDVAQWGTPVDELTFLQAPPRSALAHAVDLLHRLGALDETGRITSVGRSMVATPVHPRLAKMIVASDVRDKALACLLATLLDERDFMHGPLDGRPTDLAVRVELVLGTVRDDRAERRGVERVRQRFHDLMKRVSCETPMSSVDPNRAAALLIRAYPDRIAVRRQPGQFQMVGGSAAWIPRTDPLAEAPFVVAADLDGNRKSARIRMALGVREDDIRESMGSEFVESRSLVWDKERGDLVDHIVVRLGGMRLFEHKTRPSPSPETTEALVGLLDRRRLRPMLTADRVGTLRARIEFLRRVFGDDWPDWSEDHLVTTVSQWLGPHLVGMTSLAEVETLDLVTVLRSNLPWPLGARLDELAPAELILSSGRRIPIDYSGAGDQDSGPTVDVRVQDLFGTTTHPTIAEGRVPLVLRLLSPAHRPIQVTADLPRFWAGTWSEVRKELAGRYPKHQWPIDPASADPKRLKDR